MTKDNNAYSNIFIHVPKFLIYADKYSNALTATDQIAFAYLLNKRDHGTDDRFFDEQGNTYITYTIDELIKLLRGASKSTVSKSLKDLEQVGLLKRVTVNSEIRTYVLDPTAEEIAEANKREEKIEENYIHYMEEEQKKLHGHDFDE